MFSESRETDRLARIHQFDRPERQVVRFYDLTRLLGQCPPQLVMIKSHLTFTRNRIDEHKLMFIRSRFHVVPERVGPRDRVDPHRTTKNLVARQLSYSISPLKIGLGSLGQQVGGEAHYHQPGNADVSRCFAHPYNVTVRMEVVKAKRAKTRTQSRIYPRPTSPAKVVRLLTYFLRSPGKPCQSDVSTRGGSNRCNFCQCRLSQFVRRTVGIFIASSAAG